jgi:hypothetical protein
MGKVRIDLRSVTTVGLDLAKHIFQHAVDADGKIVIATALRREDVLSFFDALPPCVIGLEACGSAHHWARELVKLRHKARLTPEAPRPNNPLAISPLKAWGESSVPLESAPPRFRNRPMCQPAEPLV